MATKNSNDIIVNRNRDLPACSAVPQPTAPSRATNVLSPDTALKIVSTSELILLKNKSREEMLPLYLCHVEVSRNVGHYCRGTGT
jgi:hypothetical protein